MPGRIERIPITDRASWLRMREQDVTASAAAALLGIHPYQTAYGLWALKTGRVAEDPDETPPMRRGRLLEPVAIALLREERPTWSIRPADEYLRDPDAGLGATPDVFAHDPQRGHGIVQIKNVEPSAFRRSWRSEETAEVEPPLWIAVQAIVEAHLAGASWAAIAALVVGHGVTLEIVDVPIHAGVVDRIREAVREFWRVVDAGEQPDPDWARDASLAARLLPVLPDTLDLSEDNLLPELLDERAGLKERVKADEARIAAIDTDIRAKVGASALATLPGWRITSKPVETKPYTVAARTTRPLRITRTKEQAA